MNKRSTAEKAGTAVFLGRFQPFHLGHLRVAKNLSSKYDKVIIPIGTRQQEKDKNPFNYTERRKMISLLMKKADIKNAKIISMPDNPSDKVWMQKLRKKIPKNSIMFSGNNYVLSLCQQYKVPAVKVRIYKGINSTEIRRRIKSHEDWLKLVDKVISDYMKKEKLLKKIE